MFEEVKAVFKNNEKSLLCEWRFHVGSYCVIPQTNEESISYVEPTRDTMHGNQLVLRVASTRTTFDNYTIGYVSSASIYKSLLSKREHIADKFNLDSLYESIIKATSADYSVEELRKIVSSDMSCINYMEAVCKYPHLEKFKMDIMKYATKYVGIFDEAYPVIVRDGEKISGFLKLNDLPQLLIVGGDLELEIISNILGINIKVVTINSAAGGFGDSIIIKHSQRKIRRTYEDCDTKREESKCITLYYNKSGCFTCDYYLSMTS
jgi:hypothetical protein